MDFRANSQNGSLGGGGLRFGRLLAFCGLPILALFVGPAAPALAIENKSLIAPITSDPPKGTHVLVDADTFTYDTNTQIGIATGKVNLVYGPYTLTATKVVYNQKTGEFDANGSIVLREPNGNVLNADSMITRNAFRDGFARHIEALLNNDGVITAPFVKRVHGNIFIYEKAHYSVCRDCVTRDGQPLWEVVSDQTTHDTKSHDLTHINPRLKIDGVTVFGLPYWKMPDPSVTRRSGFLPIDIRAGSDFGFGLVTPYFLALTPSTDITVRPVWTTKQGPIADVEWRQATETGGYNIRGYGVHQFTKLAAPEDADWRGAVDTHGAFNAGQDWNYGWDGTFASDRTFLSSYGYDYRSYAVNDAYATGLWDQTYVSAKMLNFGSLSTGIDPDQMPYAMPFVTGETILRDTPIGGQFDFTWNAYSLHRDKTATPFTTVNQGLDQTRGTTQMNWHRQVYGDAGTVITPFANLRGDILVTNEVPDATAVSGYSSTTAARMLPEVGVDARWPFVANTSLGQSVISPVVQIVASTNEGTTNAFGNEDSITLNYDHSSLFLADRFTGLDRYEGGTHADIGVTYSLISRNGGLIRASAGQSIHLAGQNSFVNGSGLADNESDLVAAIILQPWSALSLSYETRVKDDFSKINRQELVASLSFDRFTTNVSYLDFGAEPAYGRNSREQWVSGDGRIALEDGWSVFGGMTYDFVSSVMTRKTAGLEFDCKCMNFKVYYAGSVDSVSKVTDNRVMMSIEFATLGKTGFNAAF